jgi:hypothetical protein
MSVAVRGALLKWQMLLCKGIKSGIRVWVLSGINFVSREGRGFCIIADVNL